MADETNGASEPSLAKELKDILARSIEGNLQLLTRVSGMVREGARALRASSAQPKQPGEIVPRLVRLNLSYLALLTKHGLAFADELTTVTERALGLKANPETPAAATSRVEINLHARVGETAIAAFLVENNQPQKLEVSFEASQIVSRGGEPIGTSAVRFDPPRLALEPQAQATVRALIDLSADFKPGELYLARIRIVGFEQKEIWIGLTVLPPAEEVPPPKIQKAEKQKNRSSRKKARPRKPK